MKKQVMGLVFCVCACVFRPFDRSMTIWKVKDCNNTLEFLLLLTLCVLSGYRVLQVDVQHGPATDNNTLPTVVFCVATVISLGIYLYQFISSWRDTIQQRPRNIVYEDDGEEDTEESESESAEHFESRVKEDMEMEVMVVEVKPARAEYRVCHAARSPKTPQWGNYSRVRSIFVFANMYGHRIGAQMHAACDFDLYFEVTAKSLTVRVGLCLGSTACTSPKY